MLYGFLKIGARLAIRIFCRKIFINRREVLSINGPVLLAANHPNSFLDSIILDTLFGKPIWSLARGDAFKKPWHAKLLTSLKILPVYRTSEGVENLSENYKTFDACIHIFRQKGIVCIFSEGKCINEWHLRPLKKGTARLAIKAWEENIPLTVIPVGLNYSSFTRFGKNVWLNFGQPIVASDINLQDADGLRNQAFNDKLRKQLQGLVLEIAATATRKQEELLTITPSLSKKILLAIPACLGWLLHAPLYLPIKNYAWKKMHHLDHYDSTVTGLLFITYPFYLLLLTSIAFIVTGQWLMIALLLLLPFFAWAHVQLKPQLDRRR